MKKILLGIILIFSVSVINGQSNNEIAAVYFKKSQKNYNDTQLNEALKNYKKGVKFIDTIVQSNTAKLGTLIYFELNNFKEAKKYAKHYFLLAKNKRSKEYEQLLEIYIAIDEKLESIALQEKKAAAELLKKQLEQRRVDSLKTLWNAKSTAMNVPISEIQPFNAHNTAVFSNDGYYGIMDDLGTVLVNADTYKHTVSYDGYVLLTDAKENPSVIYYYDSKARNGGLLPSVSEFNKLSTHYGEVMLPRANGIVVTYPNNSLKAYVYDISNKSFVTIVDKPSLLKKLRKEDKIDKFDKAGKVRISKVYYNLGGTIGGDVYPLFFDDYRLYGYLCGIDGSVLPVSLFNAIGGFHNNSLHVMNADGSFWVNQNGTKISDATNEAGTYAGITKVVRLENGSYQLHQKIDGKDYIVLGDEKLEFMDDFLLKYPAKE